MGRYHLLRKKKLFTNISVQKKEIQNSSLYKCEVSILYDDHLYILYIYIIYYDNYMNQSEDINKKTLKRSLSDVA